ncbi:MAG TPA: class I SAM-dependent methyltransferase [Pyrinomonadaceae bacterium]|nr:class I SAM-dependent methyltransferase [Pyrinomonadaceae bacterium]
MIKIFRQIAGRRQRSSRWSQEEFRGRLAENISACRWDPHPLYSVFTQFDKEFYLAQREAFLHKYRSFYAVSKTIAPERMFELGVCAGAGADAYLSACPRAEYTGIDTFGEPFSEDDDSPWRSLRVDETSLWKPRDIAERLLTERGFHRYKLITANLRHLDKLPHRADLVIVDAAHDFENEYADLRLALTADPSFIFVDDAEDEAQAKPALDKFLSEDLQGRVEYTLPVDYIGGGLIIKLKK